MRVSVDEVSKSFGDRRVLNGISFAHTSHDLVSLMGPSGSGKSTLLDIIAGRLDPDRGSVRREPAGSNIAWLAQSSPALLRRTAVDNVTLGGLLRWPDLEGLQSRVEATMENLSISHLARSRMYTLSGGERQRVAVGRAIVAGSPLILADEPTASLDRHSAALVTEALVKAAEFGALVIVATHDADVAAACTHVHDLRTGES